MMNMLLMSFAEYQNVIQINETDDVEKFKQSLIHIDLKES